MKSHLLVLALLSTLQAAQPVSHLPASSVEAPAIPAPRDKHVPFGWPSAGLAPASDKNALTLKWSGKSLPPGSTVRLRLTSAIDSREENFLEIALIDPPEVLGELDFTLAPALQIAELALTREQAGSALKNGVSITRTKGGNPYRVFSTDTASSIPLLLRPHLMIAEETNPWTEFMHRLDGVQTIQPFGWMEGCLLDGLHDLSRAFREEVHRKSLDQRLDLYLGGTDLLFESPRSSLQKNVFHSIEDTLPLAAICRYRPDHPSIGLVLEFWQKELKKDGFYKGSIQGGPTTSAEGSYTIAYPLMVIAAHRGDPALAELALNQIRLRSRLLKDAEGNIYLRNFNQEHVMKNWARGVAWYYLGLIRTLIETPEGLDTADIRADALTAMDFILSHQDENGLWKNFFDDPDQKPDTSGSAGIAAALALGHKHGILPEKANAAARKTLRGLSSYLTADGLLAGGTPSNREDAAQGNRRVIFPVGMGLAAQLIAALGEQP